MQRNGMFLGFLPNWSADYDVYWQYSLFDPSVNLKMCPAVCFKHTGYILYASSLC